MRLKSLSGPLLAATMIVGGAGAALAQSWVPFPTGSVGNSNTGPGAQYGGHTGILGQTGPSPYYDARSSYYDEEPMTTGSIVVAPGRFERHRYVDDGAPYATGSVGNSNTGPGARFPY